MTRTAPFNTRGGRVPSHLHVPTAGDEWRLRFGHAAQVWIAHVINEGRGRAMFDPVALEGRSIVKSIWRPFADQLRLILDDGSVMTAYAHAVEISRQPLPILEDGETAA